VLAVELGARGDLRQFSGKQASPLPRGARCKSLLNKAPRTHQLYAFGKHPSPNPHRPSVSLTSFNAKTCLRSMIRLWEIEPETGLAGSGRPPCSEVKRGRGGRLLRDSRQVSLLYEVGARKLTAPAWSKAATRGEWLGLGGEGRGATTTDSVEVFLKIGLGKPTD
jgi:hypothetical protein